MDLEVRSNDEWRSGSEIVVVWLLKERLNVDSECARLDQIER